MAKTLLDNLGVYTLLEQERSMGMPSIMKTCSLKATSAGEISPRSSNRVGAQRLAVRSTEYQVIFLQRYPQHGFL
jgi:hypothetical protein